MRAGLAILLLAVLLIIASEVYFKPNQQYRHAAELASSGKIDDAIKAFRDLDDFKDSPEQVQELTHAKADQMAHKGDYERAAQLLYDIIDYRDAGAILDLHGGDSSYYSDYTLDNYATKPEEIGFWSLHLHQESISVYKYFTSYNSDNQKITKVELLPD